MGIDAATAQVHLDGFQHRCGIICRQQSGKVQIIDEVTIGIQVRLKSFAEVSPTGEHGASRREQVSDQIGSGGAEKLLDQLGLGAYPLSQIIERFLSLNGGAIVAHQKHRSFRIVFVTEHLVVDIGEQHLGAC
ncbi:MAG: hypothetical protein BWY63_00649 [Chloroflexi bacterium ADurb.Bin360]|nr:MAG: hypothetical protein BWY63_00649 [Chloroflexi bacterium ADurb.Bin360]